MSMFLINLSSDQVVQGWDASRQKLSMNMSLVQIALSAWNSRTVEQQRLAKQEIWTAVETAGLVVIQRFMMVQVCIITAVTSNPVRACSLNSPYIHWVVLTTCNCPGFVSILVLVPCHISNGLDSTGGIPPVSGWILILRQSDRPELSFICFNNWSCMVSGNRCFERLYMKYKISLNFYMSSIISSTSIL